MSSTTGSALSPSAHTDTFARDHLPPADQWPTLEFTTPELQYPERLNAAVELLDATIRTHGPDRPALRTPDGTTWSYGELLERSNQVAAVLSEDLGLVWMEKSYDLAATTGPDGELHVMLGVWGTFEVTRTYYVDAVLIAFTRAEAQRSS